MSNRELRALIPIFGLAVIGDICSSLLIIMGVFYSTELGFTTTRVGWISSGYGLTYLFMPAILGRMGDKIPRKWSLIIATSAQTLLSLYFILIIFLKVEDSFGFLLAGFIFKGIAYGFFWPSVEAFISERTEHDHRLHKWGITGFCISWSIGYTIGPLLAGYFTFLGVIIGFAVSGGFFLIGLFLIIFLVPSKMHIPTNANDEILHDSTIAAGARVGGHGQQRLVAFLVLTSSLMYAVLVRVVFNYFANYSVLDGGLGWTTILSGKVIFAIGLGRTAYFLIGWKFENTFRKISVGLVIVGVLIAALALTENIWAITLLMLTIGFYQGRTYYMGLEILLKSEREAKGSKAGLFESTIGLGASFTPIIAGALAKVTLTLPFIVFGGISVLLGTIHFFLQRKTALPPDKNLHDAQ